MTWWNIDTNRWPGPAELNIFVVYPVAPLATVCPPDEPAYVLAEVYYGPWLEATGIIQRYEPSVSLFTDPYVVVGTLTDVIMENVINQPIRYYFKIRIGGE